jgi:uncharacterized protein YbjT (DUF2867 family)
MNVLVRVRCILRASTLAACLLLLLPAAAAALSSSSKVAVIGATGRLGRAAVQQLSQQGIPTRCLVRHDIAHVPIPSSLQEAESSAQVGAYLSTLPGVELVKGDINNEESLRHLVEGCTACLALHGSVAPKPFFKALVFPSLLFPDTDPSHAKQVNYEGIRKLIAVVEASPTCQRLVRITGKGETPWSIFSILINALSGLAKGWNYEGEQLLRKSTVPYTIVRPGVMKEQLDQADTAKPKPLLGLKDNGQDMKVTPVSYNQIADLVIQSLDYPNCERVTLTAMNLAADSPDGTSTYGPLLERVQSDSREFPESLLKEHRKAARVGGLTIMTVFLLGMQALLRTVFGFFSNL